MRKLQAPQWSCESQSPAAFLQGSWVLLPGPGAAILSRDQQPECLRAGGSKALKGEPPPGRLLPPPRILSRFESFLPWHGTPAASSPQPHSPLDLLPKRRPHSFLAHQRLHDPSCPQSHPDTLSGFCSSPMGMQTSPFSLPHRGARHTQDLTSDLCQTGDPFWGDISSMANHQQCQTNTKLSA